MKALTLNCTLKRSPEESNTGSLASVVEEALREHGVETDEIRVADHVIEPGADEREWTITTGKTAAQNIVAVARGLAASPIPAPPS
jgi:multimeric flavodoxin WrbA